MYLRDQPEKLFAFCGLLSLYFAMGLLIVFQILIGCFLQVSTANENLLADRRSFLFLLIFVFPDADAYSSACLFFELNKRPRFPLAGRNVPFSQKMGHVDFGQFLLLIFIFLLAGLSIRKQFHLFPLLVGRVKATLKSTLRRACFSSCPSFEDEPEF